jgi:hypothetical protein
MVYSVGFGASALMAAAAVWRANSVCPHFRPEQPYVVQIQTHSRSGISDAQTMA